MRFGLVGAGEIGTLRAQAISTLRWAQLAAVAEVEPTRGTELGGRRFEDWRALIEEAEIDAVIVSTPPDAHEEIVRAALQAGKHALCEKPLAPTPQACRSLVETARASKSSLAVGFNQRYFPAVAFVKHCVEKGAIGRPLFARAYAGHRGVEELRREWERRPEAIQFGSIMDNGIHLIDHVRCLLGEFDRVQGAAGLGNKASGAGPGDAFALLTAQDGRFASLGASWSEWRGYRFHIDVYGDEGMARAYYGPMFAMVRGRTVGGKRKTKYFPATALREKLLGWQSTVLRTFTSELEDFRRLVSGEPASIAEGFDGFRAVEIAHATLKSATSGESVRLSERF